MPAETPLFAKEEFQARTARLQDEMARAQVQALLLTNPADIFYVTGFLTRFWESPARPWFVVVPASGSPVAVIPAIGATLMGQTWISEIRTWDAPNPTDDGVSLLAETLSAVTPPGGAVAIPMGLETHVRMPYQDLRHVMDLLHPRQFVDGTAIVQRTREIKSDAEITKLRAVCEITSTAFSRLEEIVAVGRPLAAVFRDFQRLLLECGADWVSYVAGAAGPNGYADVIAPATEAPLAAGDVLMLDTGAVKDGYFSDFDRNVFLGPATAETQRVQVALWQATEDTLSALRPGMLASDAHRLLSEGLLRHGARPCPGRLGHGLGITLTEWPSFTPRDTTELREGMVLTLEPSAFVTDTTFLVHEENLVLRKDGPELLSHRASRKGHVIPA